MERPLAGHALHGLRASRRAASTRTRATVASRQGKAQQEHEASPPQAHSSPQTGTLECRPPPCRSQYGANQAEWQEESERSEARRCFVEQYRKAVAGEVRRCEVRSAVAVEIAYGYAGRSESHANVVRR